jgi:N-acetylneuraminic acid mutarotase
LTVQFTSNGSVVESGWVATISCIFIAEPTNLTATPLNRSQIRLNWSDVSGETGYRIYRSGFGGYTQLATVGADVNTFTDSGLTAGTGYYYYLQAYNAFGNSPQTPTVYAHTATLSDYVMDGSPVSTCDGTFYDPGFNNKYGNNQSFTQTFSPTSVNSKVRLTFSRFVTESGFDVLRIYDGPSTASPLLGTYSGTMWPGIVTATNATGQLTVQFTSNGSVVESGWQAAISCPPVISSFAPNSAPVGAAVAIKGSNFSSSTSITVRFNGVNAPNFTLESSNLVVATVPPGATSGPIEVTSKGVTVTSASNLTIAPVTSIWQPKTDVPTARGQHGAVALPSNGQVYVFGGAGNTNLADNVNSMEVYNPNTNAWAAGAPMPVATRSMAYTLGSDGLIYVFGGLTRNGYNNRSYRFNPLTNTWTSVADSPSYAWGATAAATSNGKIYLFGGRGTGGPMTNETHVYTIATNSWAAAAPMPVAVGHHRAVTGQNGKIYVFGGKTSVADGLSDLVQIYTPATNSWAFGAPMPIAKCLFGTIQSNNGKIYIIGGKTAFYLSFQRDQFFHTVEIYDPATNTWSAGPPLSAPVGDMTTVNANGNVFLTGGTSAYTHYRNFNWQLAVPPSAPSGGVSAPPFNDQPTAARVSVEPALKLEASPNPFSEKVTFHFTVEKTQPASLEIYDMKGVLVRKLFEGEAQAGRHYQVEWNAALFKSGLFIGRLTSGNQSVTRKVILQR